MFSFFFFYFQEKKKILVHTSLPHINPSRTPINLFSPDSFGLRRPQTFPSTNFFPKKKSPHTKHFLLSSQKKKLLSPSSPPTHSQNFSRDHLTFTFSEKKIPTNSSHTHHNISSPQKKKNFPFHKSKKKKTSSLTLSVTHVSSLFPKKLPLF